MWTRLLPLVLALSACTSKQPIATLDLSATLVDMTADAVSYPPCPFLVPCDGGLLCPCPEAESICTLDDGSWVCGKPGRIRWPSSC